MDWGVFAPYVLTNILIAGSVSWGVSLWVAKREHKMAQERDQQNRELNWKQEELKEKEDEFRGITSRYPGFAPPALKQLTTEVTNLDISDEDLFNKYSKEYTNAGTEVITYKFARHARPLYRAILNLRDELDLRKETK